MSTSPSLPAIFVLRHGRVVDSLRKSPQLFGAPRDQIVAELENTLLDSGEQSLLHWHSRRLDGSCFTVEASLSHFEIEGHAAVIAVLVDPTTDLTARLLARQDQEQRRVARQLHNQAGQNLSALNINLSLLQSSALNPRSREALQEAIDLAEASIREIRKLSYELHPPLLDELGLVSALRAYVEGFVTTTGIQVHLTLPSAGLRLPPAAEIGLFRIAEEGLENIHRHARSKAATLTLKLESNQIELALHSSSLGDESPAIMQERARQLGGSLSIASGPRGSTLHVVIPASKAAAT